jgi:hypothetical protein
VPLILLLLSLGTAHGQGSVIWLRGPIDHAATEGLVDISVEDITEEEDWTESDSVAIDALAAELEAVRPLVQEFDGELEIMARLQQALADVHIIRGNEDRALVFDALVFQGFAVKRYFQDGLATDLAAEAYRVRLGDTVVVAPWVDAVALDPEREVTAEDIAEEPERRAFADTRAHLLVAARATVSFPTLPHGAFASVDGRLLTWDQDGSVRARLLPGRHRIALWQGEQIIARDDLWLHPDATHTFHRLPTPRELDGLAWQLTAGADALRLEPVVVEAMQPLEPPVFLAVAGETEPWLYQVEGFFAVNAVDPEPVAPEPPPEPEPRKWPVAVHALTGMAWMYDGNFYESNEDEGAPQTFTTSHAAPPIAGLAVTGTVGSAEVGAGVDAAVPPGRWHHLDAAGGELRLRVHPYFSLGPDRIPIRLTVGALLPWHISVGIRGRWELWDNMALTAAWVQGIGVARPASQGPPVPAHLAVIGITSSLGAPPRSGL